MPGLSFNFRERAGNTVTPLGGDDGPRPLVGVDAWGPPSLITWNETTGARETEDNITDYQLIYAVGPHPSGYVVLLRGEAMEAAYTRVRLYDPEHTQTWEWEHDKEGARNATWWAVTDVTGNTYVGIQTSSTTMDVVKIDTSGSTAWQTSVTHNGFFSTSPDPPSGSTFGPKVIPLADHVWVKGQTTVYALSQVDGTLIDSAEEPDAQTMRDAVVTSDGTLWVLTAAAGGTIRPYTLGEGEITPGSTSVLHATDEVWTVAVNASDVIFFGGQHSSFDGGLSFGAFDTSTTTVLFNRREEIVDVFGILQLVEGDAGWFAALDVYNDSEPELRLLSAADGSDVAGFSAPARSEGYVLIALMPEPSAFLATWDGLPLTTWDGVALMTWEG